MSDRRLHTNHSETHFQKGYGFPNAPVKRWFLLKEGKSKIWCLLKWLKLFLTFLTSFLFDIRTWLTETQTNIAFYAVECEPILCHWSLCIPTEIILSSHFLFLSGSIDRDMWHEVGLRTLKNSPSQTFFRIGVLKISQYSKENTWVGVFFNKVTGLQPCSFFKKRLQPRYFTCFSGSQVRVHFSVRMQIFDLHLSKKYKSNKIQINKTGH